MTLRRAPVALLVLLALAPGCERPATREADPAFERTVVLGPATLPAGPPETAPLLRAPLDPEGLSWIVGFRAEADPGARVTDAGVTLDFEADVVRVSADAPALDLPDGLGVPLLRARAELPGTWRGLRVTARAVGARGRADAAQVRATVRARGPAADGAMTPVWRIPVDVDPAAVLVRGPDGRSTVKVRLADAMPAAGTVHAIVPRTSGSASEVRMVSADGEVVARLIRDAAGRLGAWADPAGLPVAPSRSPRLEFDLAPGDDLDDLAIDVYLAPVEGVALRYADPDEGS